MPCCWKRHFLTVLSASGNILPEIYKLLSSGRLSVHSLHCGNPPPRGASLKGTVGRKWSSGHDGGLPASIYPLWPHYFMGERFLGEVETGSK